MEAQKICLRHSAETVALILCDIFVGLLGQETTAEFRSIRSRTTSPKKLPERLPVLVPERIGLA
jgi:hypothetical protein